MDEDSVMVQLTESMTSISSNDSTFSVLNNPPPTFNSALKGDGPHIYEERTDIIETKKLADVIKKNHKFSDKESVEEIYSRINARDNLDEEIENEAKHVSDLLEENSKNVNEKLINAAIVAKENIGQARTVARDGKTTVKRAMEIIEEALPVFVEAWSKSQEQNKPDEKVMKELTAFEETRASISEAKNNIEKRKQRTIEAEEKLRNTIDLAEKDAARLTEKRQIEISHNREDNCRNVKDNIENIICLESEEVSDWMIQCKNDSDELVKFKGQQMKRHELATNDFKKNQDHIEHKIESNRKNQMELRKKIEILESEEKKMEQEKSFQQKVQKRAEDLHTELCNDINQRCKALNGIYERANTSQKVLELMQTCGNELLDASITSENIYLANLLELEKESKKLLRFALANEAVELMIKKKNSLQNINDCKENMKVYKDKLKEATKILAELAAKRAKENYNEYRNELKRAQSEMEETEKKLKIVTERLDKCDEDLRSMGVESEALDTMYEIRIQEFFEMDQDSNSLSSDVDSEDEYDDAQE